MRKVSPSHLSQQFTAIQLAFGENGAHGKTAEDEVQGFLAKVAKGPWMESTIWWVPSDRFQSEIELQLSGAQKPRCRPRYQE